VSSDPAWPFLSDPAHPFLSAVWAVLIHGVICLIAVAPIVMRSRHRLGFAVLAFFGGSLIDLDHFVQAGSTNLHTVESLSGRPDTHSLLFVVGLTLIVLIATRRALAAWSVFAVNVAHLLFDAAGGGEHILYPLTGPDGLPWLAAPIGALVLCAASEVIARTVRPTAPSTRPGTRHPGTAEAG
jgi:LexA-binding, inner membrane-associated putative hydrolase